MTVFKYDNKSTVVWQVDPTFPDYALPTNVTYSFVPGLNITQETDLVVLKEGQNYFQSSDYDRCL